MFAPSLSSSQDRMPWRVGPSYYLLHCLNVKYTVTRHSYGCTFETFTYLEAGKMYVCAYLPLMAPDKVGGTKVLGAPRRENDTPQSNREGQRRISQRQSFVQVSESTSIPLPPVPSHFDRRLPPRLRPRPLNSKAFISTRVLTPSPNGPCRGGRSCSSPVYLPFPKPTDRRDQPDARLPLHPPQPNRSSVYQRHCGHSPPSTWPPTAWAVMRPSCPPKCSRPCSQCEAPTMRARRRRRRILRAFRSRYVTFRARTHPFGKPGSY